MMSGLRLEFGATIWLIPAAAAVSALAAILYRPAFGAASRRSAAAMTALRASAVLMLALFILDPVLSFPGLGGENRVLLLVDSSMSMGVADRAGGRTRLDAAKEALLSGDDPLLPALERGVKVGMFSFGAAARRVEGAESLRALSASEDATDIEAAIESAREQTGRLPAAVVIVSDGVNSEGAGADSRPVQVPVIALAVGGEPDAGRGFTDLSVAQVTGSDSVFLGQPHQITVRVESRGAGPAEIPVTVRRGKTEVASGTVTLAAGDSTAGIDMTFTPAEKGVVDYEVSVPVSDGEVLAANNVFRFPLHVLSGKIRTLYIEGSLRWEYKYLKSALFEDPNVECTALVRTAPGTFVQQGGGRSMTAGGKLEIDRDSLSSFDAVIIGDIEAAAFEEDQAKALVWFAAEHGGGLIMLGGFKSFGAGGWGGTALEEAMPVWAGSAARTGQAVHARLAPEGMGHPIFAGFEGFFSEGGGLPPLDGMNRSAGIKPGASVLAASSETGDPVVAVQRYGAGKSVAVAADTLWKWYLHLKGMGRESPYNRFWMQTLRWIAADAQEQGEASPLAVRTDRKIYRPGGTARVDVTVRKLPGGPEIAGEPSLEVVAPSGRSSIVALSGKAPLFSGRFDLPVSGAYAVRAAARSADGKSFERSAVVSAGGRSGEFERLSADAAHLRRLASATGGGFFTLPEASGIRARVRDLLLDRGVRIETGPYRSPVFFIVFLGLLGMEWIIRRRNMMV